MSVQACLCVKICCTVCWCLQRSGQGVGNAAPGLQDGCELPNMGAEDELQASGKTGSPALLTEPSLYPYFFLKIFLFFEMVCICTCMIVRCCCGTLLCWCVVPCMLRQWRDLICLNMNKYLMWERELTVDRRVSSTQVQVG